MLNSPENIRFKHATLISTSHNSFSETLALTPAFRVLMEGHGAERMQTPYAHSRTCFWGTHGGPVCSAYADPLCTQPHLLLGYSWRARVQRVCRPPMHTAAPAFGVLMEGQGAARMQTPYAHRRTCFWGTDGGHSALHQYPKCRYVGCMVGLRTRCTLARVYLNILDFK